MAEVIMAQQIIDNKNVNNTTNGRTIYTTSMRYAISLDTLKNLTISQIQKHHQFILHSVNKSITPKCFFPQRKANISDASGSEISATDILDNCEINNWDSDLVSDNIMVICGRMK
jgi:hypothetical protein